MSEPARKIVPVTERPPEAVFEAARALARLAAAKQCDASIDAPPRMPSRRDAA